jgi:putative membrane protein
MSATVDDAKARLRRAIEGVEGRSAAEVVVGVRPSAGSYLGIDLAVGSVLAHAVLLFTLYAPPVFDLHWIAMLVPAAVVLGIVIMRAMPRLRSVIASRWITQTVRDRARVLFVDLGVSATLERTGILVFVAQAEQRCVVLADYGVRAAVPEAAWTEIVKRIERSARIDALVQAIEAAGDALAKYLPRREGDANELEDVAW